MPNSAQCTRSQLVLAPHLELKCCIQKGPLDTRITHAIVQHLFSLLETTIRILLILHLTNNDVRH